MYGHYYVHYDNGVWKKVDPVEYYRVRAKMKTHKVEWGAIAFFCDAVAPSREFPITIGMQIQ